MTGTEIYKRTPAYEREAREIRLHAPHWKLLLAFDGQRTLAEVALSAETPFAEALPLTRKFLDKLWIEEQPITLDQYMKRTNARDLSTTGGLVPPTTVLHEPKKEAATPPAVVTPPPIATPKAVATPAPPPLPVAGAKAVEAASPLISEAPFKPNGRPMKLSAVVNFITSLVGNIAVGQLLVYRVFLRVPPELLLAEDVASVHLVNDTSLIRTEKLQQAIAEAVQAVGKRALPESVFVAA
jgi:hypothetical protein